MSKKPYPLRELIKKLKSYGVVVMGRKRGKGSEVILLLPDKLGSTKGPQYPIKNHGRNTEIQVAVVKAALRRFGIEEKGFWD